MVGMTKALVARIDPLWTATDVSRFLGVPIGTLYRWRTVGTGPEAFRVGRHLRYDPESVRCWLAEQAA